MSSLAPKIAVIKKIHRETRDMRTFKAEFPGNKRFSFVPGQFVEVSVFGAGEFPCSISSNPLAASGLSLSVKRVGKATSALFDLREGSFIGIRGPFGNGFPLDKAKGKELVLVGGGIGFAPLKPVVHFFASSPGRAKELRVFAGAREPSQLLFKGHLRKWKKAGVKTFNTIDHPCIGWKKEVGFVSCLLTRKSIPSRDSVAFVCGPPAMMESSARILKDLGLKEKNIFLSLETLMSCGIGKCWHCRIGSKRVCVDGPVFSLKEIKEFPKED